MKERSILLLTIALAGCATGKVATDTVTKSTVVDGDATAMVQGCGNQPVVGFAYCRKQEGDSTDDVITFIGPPSKCARETCVFIKVFNNQGDLVFGAPIPKDQTQLTVTWRQLLDQPKDKGVVLKNDGTPVVPSQNLDVFSLSQRGFWSWNLQVYFIGEDGRERQSQAQGDIVLRIYKKSYTPLHEVSNDPNFIWEWQMPYLGLPWDFKMTSSLRSYVGLHE